MSVSGKWHSPHLLMRSDGQLLLLLLLLHLPLLLESAFLVTHLVLGQVVGTHEPSAAHGAAELLLAGVSASMPRQLVRSGEASAAALNLAFVRALT